MARLKTIRLWKFKFTFKNFTEFILLYTGIYLLGRYKFSTEKEDPIIIDCGSHIGIGILSFKGQYPKSKIIGFEPNSETFKILERNVKQNNLKGVELINAAVGNKEGSIDFYINTKDSWSWNDSILKTWSIKNEFKKVKVKSVKLSKYLNGEVDLLKLNIEGSEGLVMKEITSKLKNVKEIYLHYHSGINNQSNNLDKTFKILDRNSYIYTIKQLGGFGILKVVTKSTINKRGQYFLFIHAKKNKMVGGKVYFSPV